MIIDWGQHVAAWSQPPVDDVGYISSAEMLTWPDEKITETIDAMRRTRYTGWRNHGGLWRDLMGLDTVKGKDVLDFGCGTGIEAAEFARAGNRVGIADISGDNLMLAMRVMELTSPADVEMVPYFLVGCMTPYFPAGRDTFDVIHCSGVLHHIPWATSIMGRFWDVLRPGGEVRLMLYSDIGWRIATGTDAPMYPVDHPSFRQFVRYFDSVGDYADWYSEDKITERFGSTFTLDRFAYLTADRRYCAAVLKPKGKS